jgi:hypothetical protein
LCGMPQVTRHKGIKVTERQVMWADVTVLRQWGSKGRMAQLHPAARDGLGTRWQVGVRPGVVGRKDGKLRGDVTDGGAGVPISTV